MHLSIERRGRTLEQSPIILSQRVQSSSLGGCHAAPFLNRPVRYEEGQRLSAFAERVWSWQNGLWRPGIMVSEWSDGVFEKRPSASCGFSTCWQRQL